MRLNPIWMEGNSNEYEDGNYTMIVRSYEQSDNTTDSDMPSLSKFFSQDALPIMGVVSATRLFVCRNE